MCIFPAFQAPVYGQDNSERIGRIRAALLFYIAKFVDLLPPGDSQSTTICLVGEDPLDDFLVPTVSGKLAGKFPLSVIDLDRLTSESIESCSMVFIGELPQAEMQMAAIVIEKWRGLSVCGEKISQKLCIVRLYEQNNKARIAVNIERAKEINLKISSELLDVAQLE